MNNKITIIENEKEFWIYYYINNKLKFSYQHLKLNVKNNLKLVLDKVEEIYKIVK